MTPVAVLFGLLGALGGLSGIAALAYIGVTRKKMTAETRKLGVETDDVLSGRALEMYDRAMLAAESAEKKAETARGEASTAVRQSNDCQDQLRAMRHHISRLETIMRDANLVPPPFLWPLHQVGERDG